MDDTICRCNHRKSYHNEKGCCGVIDSNTGESYTSKHSGFMLECKCQKFEEKPCAQP